MNDTQTEEGDPVAIMQPGMHGETTTTKQNYGGHSMVAPLRRVLVRRPSPPAGPDDGGRFNFPRPVDHERAVAEHDAFREILEGGGIEVLTFEGEEPGQLDAIFVYDPSFTTDAGVLLCRPGKDVRLPEVALAERAYAELDIPILGRIDAPGTLEGGDMLWLDEQTLAVGEGYRTNAAGIAQLEALLGPIGVQIVRVPLPHWHGPDECLHLLSLISPVAERLAVVHLPLLPAPFVALLTRADWTCVEIPDDEFATQGTNVLALAPGKVLMLEDNPVTIERLRAAGIKVLTYTGNEISHNRAGGPTCLTRPILREHNRAGKPLST